MNTGTQTITQTYYTASGAPASHVSPTVTAGGFGLGVVSTSGETDILYKGLDTTSASSEGIDYCGPNRVYTNFVQRGGTYSLTCYGIATNWNSSMNCASACGTTPINFGTGITINSISVASATQLTVNFTLASNVDAGAQHITFDHVWAHGSDGQIYSTASTPTNLLPCNQSGYVGNNCYVVNAEDVPYGIACDGPHCVVVDSYINAIHDSTIDSQALGIRQGTGPALFKNNFLSASTENIFTGGGSGWGITSSVIAASDVEVVGNYIYKPPAWNNGGVGTLISGSSGCSATQSYPTGSHYNCVWSVKNLWETKACNRCWVHQNVMENNWPGAVQTYAALNFTGRIGTAQGTIASSTNDVLIENNILAGIHDALLLTDYDANVGYTTNTGGIDPMVDMGAMPTIQARRNVIRNNLFIINGNATTAWNSLKNWASNTAGVTIRDTYIGNNTWLPVSGFSVNNLTNSFGGPYFSSMSGATCPTSGSTTQNLWYVNNVAFLGVGAVSGCTAPQLAPNPSTAGIDFNARFAGNVLPQPGNGTMPTTTYYSTIPASGIPTVANAMPNSYPLLNQSQPFTTDYTLTGPSALSGWVGSNSNTTNGLTAGVNMAPLTSMVPLALSGVSVNPPVNLLGNIAMKGNVVIIP